jgi:signal transduction histidine kinase
MSTPIPHLDIDAHVVIQLGAELISDSEQALLELVKNSYDGDATRCIISIEPEWIPEATHPWHSHLVASATQAGRVGRIVVEDNGDGISAESITKGWLLISASLKRADGGSKTKTGKQRTPVGDKGLGRLATMRLGDVLFLCTRTAKDPNPRTVAFAWSSFKSGKALNEIPVDVQSGGNLGNRTHGTNVEVLGLKDIGYWDNDRNISGVLAKLSSLISPFRRMQDFYVALRYQEQTRDLQSLSAEALNYAAAKFTFSYANGVLSFHAWFAKSLFRGAAGEKDRATYDRLLADDKLPAAIEFFAGKKRIQGLSFKSLLDEPGGWLFSVEDSIARSDLPSDPSLAGESDPGPFEAEIYYFLFNEPTTQALQAASIPVDMLKEMTTVGMFRDGFRVRMDDDWLNISRGVTSGGFFQLRPRNVIGFFQIDNAQNAGLVEKSDREGFVDNPPWRGFMRLANRSIHFANASLEAVRSTYDEYKKKNTAATTSNDDAPTAQDTAEVLRRSESAATHSLKVASTRSAAIAKTISAVRAVLTDPGTLSTLDTVRKAASDLESISATMKEFEASLSDARRNADEGFAAANHLLHSQESVTEHNLRLIDAAAVGLSARGLTHEIHAHVSLLEKGLAAVRRFNRTSHSKTLDTAIDNIAGAIRELKKTVASINPLLTGSRSLKDNFYVGDALKEFFEFRQSRLTELDITHWLSGGQGPHIRFARARFNQVLENLFQNSAYWIEEHANDERISRTITIECDKNGFTWWDGGKGVRDGVASSLFEPYVTDKPANKGQGLGLFLVTAFMNAEKCSMSLLDDRNTWGRRYKFRADFRGAITK